MPISNQQRYLTCSNNYCAVDGFYNVKHRFVFRRRNNILKMQEILEEKQSYHNIFQSCLQFRSSQSVFFRPHVKLNIREVRELELETNNQQWYQSLLQIQEKK